MKFSFVLFNEISEDYIQEDLNDKNFRDEEKLLDLILKSYKTLDFINRLI